MSERRRPSSSTSSTKTFRKPFTGKKVEAVRGVSFEVAARRDLRLPRPERRRARRRRSRCSRASSSPTGGQRDDLRRARALARGDGARRLPAREPVRLSVPHAARVRDALRAAHRACRGATLARRASRASSSASGIAYAIDRPVRALSKGMLQRAGLAAALVHDPELLILDEPMSGLDPVGRKEVRDLIVEERARGRDHLLLDATS